MAHPNEETLRKGYAAFDAYDMDGVRAFFADDIVWHAGGRNPLSGTYKGQDEVFGFFAKLLEVTEGTFKVELHDVLANDTHAVALTTARAQRGGKNLELRDAAIYHLRDGKVTEAWFFAEDQYAEDEFYS